MVRTPKDESKAWVGVKIKTEPIKWTVEQRVNIIAARVMCALLQDWNSKYVKLASNLTNSMFLESDI